MTKQVIVVVHGVGVKQAGVSSDLLGAALQGENGASARLPPHSTDDFLLLEDKKYDQSNKASTFPARIRRYRSYDKNGKVEDERVIADFFWGDVTAFGASAIGVTLAYFKVAMGLSHAIRENAKEIYPGMGFFERSIRALASGAALALHGPIIAINIVLLIGLFLAGAISQILPDTIQPATLLQTQVIFIGLAAFSGGLFLTWRGGSFLFRHLMSWVAITGALFLIAGSPELLGYNAFGKRIDGILSTSTCSIFQSDYMKQARCEDGYKDIFSIGLRLMAIMYFMWIILFLQIASISIADRVQIWRGRTTPVPKIVIPAIGLMSLLWFLLIGAIWAAVLKLPATFGTAVQQEHVIAAIAGIVPSIAGIVLLGLVAIFTFRIKGELKRGEFKDPNYYMKDNGEFASTYADKYRLLIRPAMLWVLIFFILLVFGLGLLSFFEATGIKGIVAEWTLPILFIILFIGTFLVYSAQAEFSAGLGILADVLAYLNDSSWNSDKGKANQTWLERLLGFKRTEVATNSNPQGYWLRQRIQDRLNVLIETLLRDEKPDRLDIVSHSQGTVIAIDLIANAGSNWLKPIKSTLPAPKIRLVTMGSPYTHLYSHYFPGSFKPVPERGCLQKIGTGEKAVLTDWLNIFRIDDFVGTHVGKGKWPREIPVPPNGHTNYWIDRTVVAELQKFLKF